jgi:hypothetical protein
MTTPIAWLVLADNGQADGVGSRFFTVANGSVPGFHEVPRGSDGVPLGSALSPTISPTAVEVPLPVGEIDRLSRESISMFGRRGFDPSSPRAMLPVADGLPTLTGEELDRFEIQIGDERGRRFTGYLRTATGLAGLPIGSHLDEASGTFSWQPSPGFLGTYDLTFVRWADGRPAARLDTRIIIRPQRSTRVPQIVIDTPRAQQAVQQPFVLGGWALDPEALGGTGISTVHVWAYPANGENPMFVGMASYGGARPDVAAIFGERFTGSGYGTLVDGLPPGTYDLAVFAWSIARGEFAPATVVRIVVR